MRLFLVVFVALLSVNAFALEKLRVGVLAFGTVNWELSVMQSKKLAQKEGVELVVKKLASKNAVAVALQAGDVDMIVSDFVWVSRQRADGHDYTYYPYSKATGGLYVRPEIKADTVLDLDGMKIGVSGGSVSKTWLFMRAYSELKYGKDLKDIVKPVFAAPPILNKKVLDGSLSGAINFWHFNAKLKASGMKEILGMDTMLEEFGVKSDIPLIGWVFSEKFANEHKKAINGFLQASYETKKILNDDDKEWDKIRHSMHAKDDKIFKALVKGYRDGIPKSFGKKEKDASKKAFDILSKVGGSKLVGKSKTLQDGTFWDFEPVVKW